MIQVANLGPTGAAGRAPERVTQESGNPGPAPSSSLRALPGSEEGVKCFWRPRAVSAAVPPSGAAAAEVGEECLQCRARREGWWKWGPVEAGPGQAPQLSNRPGPAGSCNSCPSCLFPPCRLPPPAACQAVGAACPLGPAARGRGTEAPGDWRPGVKKRIFQRERGVQSAQPPWPREGKAFAQGHTGRRHHPTGPHAGFRLFCSHRSRLQLSTM